MAVDTGAFLATLEDELADLEQRRDAILKIKEGVTTYERVTGVRLAVTPAENGNGSGHQNGHRADEPGAEKPRGREAVRQIVSDRPGIWTLTELVREFERREWLVTRKAVEVAVHRLTNAGEARRVGNGSYEFPATPATKEDALC